MPLDYQFSAHTAAGLRIARSPHGCGLLWQQPVTKEPAPRQLYPPRGEQLADGVVLFRVPAVVVTACYSEARRA
jgi:hypothetical protein